MYIPMRHGFMYLTAIIDVYSRKIVGWGISNSLAAQWCKNVLQEAISKYGNPEIVNSDQGTQYTVLYGRSTWNLSAYKYPWMEKEGPWITSGSNGSGIRSNTTTST
ncbi:MAG: DDE-type integrase/transposase/recombinase [Chitinophagales bacterium]